MKPLPQNVKRIPYELLGALTIDVETGKKFAYTEVQGQVQPYVQQEEGLFKGKQIHKITFQCPHCEMESYIHSPFEHGEHPVRCTCDATLIFLVKW